MFLRSLAAPVKTIPSIRAAVVSAYARLGILSVSDLLLHYPRAYEDRSRIVPIKNFKEENVCAAATVTGIKRNNFKGKDILKIYIEDESSPGVLVFFNQPWNEKKFFRGGKYWVYGTFKYERGEICSTNFTAKPYGENANFNRIMPVYPLTAGLSQENARKYSQYLLDKYGKYIGNELPQEIIEKYRLLPKNRAVRAIHYPLSETELEKAKKTLIYEELFYLEILVGQRAHARSAEKRKLSQQEDGNGFSPLQNRLLERLSFSLTAGQKEAVKEINCDLNRDIPMARLIQGDVGSGKTLVSFLAALRITEGGAQLSQRAQTAVMAPTELLARQHAENAALLLEPLGCRIAFLTGNIKAAGRKELLKNLAKGEIDIVIGTHALFSKDVIYKNLKLAIIDEQHRFGVTQRALILQKGNADKPPSLLMMSATPIPRSLALTVFGDMDISIIKDMPPGRKPAETHLAKLSNENKVYGFVKRELEKGRQAYFVYPLIEGGNSDADLKDAVSMAEKLREKIFPQYKTALIHSKLPEEEKQKTMDSFRKGDIQILAATSVVEVGVDVPNATCMVIEHAERFGLSALHQLRGRVGRGNDQSYCFLVYGDGLTEDGKTRLKKMLESNDGFVIAEEDLKLRGPGAFAGTEQSGFFTLGISNPVRDIKILEIARNDAFNILENDPDLLLEDHRVIQKALEEAPPFSGIAF